MQTSELGVTEHVEGDPCKFALWVGRTPTSDNKIVLKVRSFEAWGCAVYAFFPIGETYWFSYRYHKKNSGINSVWYLVMK